MYVLVRVRVCMISAVIFLPLVIHLVDLLLYIVLQVSQSVLTVSCQNCLCVQVFLISMLLTVPPAK